MYAVIQVGSSQFKVAEGDTIHIDRLKDEEGSNITLDKVLMFADGADIRIGQPFLKDVKVTAKVEKHRLGDKVIAFKYRRRCNSSTKTGCHRKLTALHITQVSV